MNNVRKISFALTITALFLMTLFTPVAHSLTENILNEPFDGLSKNMNDENPTAMNLGLNKTSHNNSGLNEVLSTETKATISPINEEKKSIQPIVDMKKETNTTPRTISDNPNPLLLRTNFSWWNTSWPYRKQITIDHELVGSDLVGFPVLIDIVDPDLAVRAQGDGDDIVFTDDLGVVLAHEIEFYDSGVLVVWVNVVNLSSSVDTMLYMYYGNPGCSSQEDVFGVWDSDFEAVWHLSETEGGVNVWYDSSGNGYHGTDINMSQGDFGTDFNASGKVDGAVRFDGVDDEIDTNLYPYDGRRTLEFWASFDNIAGNSTIGCHDRQNHRFYAGIKEGSAFFGVGDDYSASIPVDASPGNWYYIVVTADDSTARYYMDSVEKDSFPYSQSGFSTDSFNLGMVKGLNYTLDGVIDEVRVSYIDRSEGWISTCFKNQQTPNNFYNIGDEESVFPAVANEFPVDGSTNIVLNPTLHADILDTNGDDVFWEICSNASGGWVVLNSSTVFGGSGTVYASSSNMSEYDTRYWWSVNCTDPLGSGVWTNETFSFTTAASASPIVTNENPEDGAVDIGFNPTLMANVFDENGDDVFWEICSNASGGWVVLNSSTVFGGSGTVYASSSNMSEYDTRYWWSVNCTDPLGSGVWTNRTFSFTTAADEAFISNVYPNNEDANYNPRLMVIVHDFQGDNLNVTFKTNASGLWEVLGNYSGGNGVYTQDTFGMDVKNQTYYWSVHVFDGSVWTNETYSFTAKPFVLKWRYRPESGNTTIGPLAADVNDDGIYEVFATIEDTVMCVNGSTGDLIWNFTYSGISYHSPFEIHDLNNDGIEEVVVAAWERTIALHANNGTVFWNVSAASQNNYLVVADIEGDGYPHVYICWGDYQHGSNGTGRLQKLRGTTGEILKEVFIWYPCWGGLSIADVENDGDFELFLTDRRASFYLGGLGKAMQCYDADTLDLLWFEDSVTVSSQCMAVVDVNGDNVLDGVTTQYGVRVVDGFTGEKMPGKWGEIETKGHSQFSIYDIDGDGHLEAITCKESPAKVWDMETWSLDATLALCGEPPKMADVIGDGNLEIIAPAGSTIWIYNGSYQLIESINTDAKASTMVQDIDGDGQNELLTITGDGILRAWDTSAYAPTPRVRTNSQYYSERNMGAGVYVPPPGAPQPILKDEYPADGAVDVGINPTLSVHAVDFHYDLMNVSISTNASGVWTDVAFFNDTGNGVYEFTPDNMDEIDTTYFWRVSAVDPYGDNLVTSETYWFTTSVAPEIMDVVAFPSLVYEGESVNISCNVTDDTCVDTVKVNITSPGGEAVNVSMDSDGVVGGDWMVLSYDDFEDGWGNYSDGGGDCLRYDLDTVPTFSYQGDNAVGIQDDNDINSSFYHTDEIDIDTSGYISIKLDFWFYPNDMDSNEKWILEYFNGSSWRTRRVYKRATGINNDTIHYFDNDQFYHEVVYINEMEYLFPSDMKIKFRCDASDDNDGIYIDQIYVNASDGTGWIVLTYDNFEEGFGNYTAGGDDCSLYTPPVHQGRKAVRIRDDSDFRSSFYHTSGIDVDTPGYTSLKIDFWYRTEGMELGENFMVRYYDGSDWIIVGNYYPYYENPDYGPSGDFVNGQFYHETIWINESEYTFPSDMKIRFQCDASNDWDYVYIDQVYVNAIPFQDDSYYYDTTYSQVGTYHYFIWANDTNGNSDISSTHQFSVDVPPVNPVLSEPLPADDATGIEPNPMLSIHIKDYQDDEVDVLFMTNASGVWDQIGDMQSGDSGVYSQAGSGMDDYNTRYWWSVNCTDPLGSGIWTNETFSFTTIASTAPIVSNENPEDGAVDINFNPILHADIFDVDSDSVDWQIRSNASGGWLTLSNSTLPNGTGTVFASPTTMTDYDTTYFWSVNCTDPLGSGVWTNETFSFTTVDNFAPILLDPQPGDHTKNVTFNPVLSIYVDDVEGDDVDVLFMTNSSGIWEQIGDMQSGGSGVYSQVGFGMDSYNTRYWWSVNCFDGTSWSNETYCFTTRFEYKEWWNTDWTYRKGMSIDREKVDTNLTNFPVMISFDSDDSLKNHAQNDCDDIVFTDYDGNQLNHEIELYDNSSGYLIAWVNVTNFSSTSDTILYMYYGNPTVDNQQNVSGVWDSYYLAVQHLNETSGQHKDSTSNNNDSTNVSVTTQGALEGVTGKCDIFDGIDDYIQFPNKRFAAGKDEITVEVWMNPDEYVPEDTIYDEWSEDNYWQYTLRFDKFYTRDASGGPTEPRDNDLSWGGSPGVGSWHHVASWYSVSTGEKRIYLDGVIDASTSTNVGTLTSDRDISSPRLGFASDGDHFDGKIDEFRVSKVARSTGWLRTTYNTISSPNTFLFIGSEETNDIIPPEISNVIATPLSASPGEYINITCTVTDNVAVNIVNVSITGPDGFIPINASMNGGSYYYNESYSIVGTYEYFIWANDTSGNSNMSSLDQFTINASEAPVIVDNSPDSSGTGNSFIVNVSVSDSDGVGSVWVEYWFDSGFRLNESMINSGGDFWVSDNVSIPSDSVDDLFYNVSAVDVFGVWGHLDNQQVVVFDDDRPEILDIQANPPTTSQGGFVNITCNVTDNIDVDAVNVNISGPDGFTSINTSMNNGSYYYNISYSIVGTYEYFIWANDSSGNVNTSNVFSFNISDSEAPEIFNIMASPELQEVGGFVNISCDVIDNIDVDIVMVNITYPDDSIHVEIMVEESGFYYNSSFSQPGIYHYFVWANDSSGNTNTSTIYTFNISDTKAPEITDVFAVPNDQEAGRYINISCSVGDNVQVDTVMLNITDPNNNMENFSIIDSKIGDIYYCERTYCVVGEYRYYIWANDTSGNTNISGIFSFNVSDTIPPEILNVVADPESQMFGSYVNITCDIIDVVGVDMVMLNITYPDSSMENISIIVNKSGDTYYSNRTYSMNGTYNYFIWANDTTNNANSSQYYYFEIYNITIPDVVNYSISLAESWNLVSIPFNSSIHKFNIIINYLGVNFSWQEAIDNDIILGYIYKWNEIDQGYEFTDILQPGKGYWIYAYDNCNLTLSSNASNNRYIMDLSTEWNLIGLPYNTSVAKENLSAYYNETEYTWEEAVNNSIILGFIYGWNEVDQGYEFIDVLYPSGGYWIYAYYDCMLLYSL